MKSEEFQDGDRRDACPAPTIIATPEEVRKKGSSASNPESARSRMSIGVCRWNLDVLSGACRDRASLFVKAPALDAFDLGVIHFLSRPHIGHGGVTAALRRH